jgi:eukaryotic-like serine/threonine-protein kinase
MSHADSNLLFGILALQNGLIDQGDLIEAFQSWSKDRSRPLSQVLLDRGALIESDLALLDGLVRRQLQKRGESLERSLVVLPVAAAVCEGLRQIADPDLDVSLARLEVTADGAVHQQCLDSEATTTWGVCVGPAPATARFRILRPHANGGLGLVSVALDQELHREVALKEIRPERADDPQSRDRFVLEAEITGRLEHPGIVPVYSLGCDVSARPFYAMRFVRGETFKESIDRLHATESNPDRVPDTRERALEFRRLLGRFLDVCNTVAYAHSRGVIHRDLKPANILLGPYGETLVVDWGLAKVVGRAGPAAGAAEGTLQPNLGSSSSETMAGTAIGTPAYMSPEQAEGQIDRIGPASDVFSLGATLYYLLTGKPSVGEGEVAELLRQVRCGEFPRPRQAQGRVPPALEAVCLKAMATRREDRYGSARALAAEIERWLADDPVSAHRDSLPTRLTRWGRRHRTIAVAIGALLVTAVAALTISTALISREQAATERQRARAATAAESLRQEDYFHRIALAHRELSADNLGGSLKLLDACPEDLRQWEWHYLERLCRVEPVILRAKADVHSVAFHPGGEQVAAACADGTVKIFDIASGKVSHTLHGHKSYVFSVAFASDGRHVASAGADRMVRLWDLATDQQVHEFPGHVGDDVGMAGAVAFSPDGRHLVAGGEDGFATVWDVAHGREVHRLPELHENTAVCVAFSPDGQLLVTGSWGGVLRTWDAQTGQLLRKKSGHAYRISAVAFSADGRWLATSSFDRTVKVWDAATGELLQTLGGHAGIITGLAFSRDGRRLFSGGAEDKIIKVWDPLTGREVLNLRGPTLFSHCLAPSPDGRLASGSADGTVQIWDATPLKRDEDRVVLTREHDEEVWSVAYSRDGRYLASGTWRGTVQLWDARTDALVHIRTLRGPQDTPVAQGVAFSPDGERLAAAAVSPNRIAVVKVWATATGREELDEIREHTSGRFWVTFDPTGRYLIREGPDHAVQVRDGVSGKEVGIVGRHERAIWGSAFSPDGRRLATASNDYKVRVWAWDPAHLGRQREPELALDIRVRGFGNRVVFSPDGRHLATGGEGHTVKVWDAKDGEAREILRGHTGDVFALAFSPDGRWLASAGEDTTVRLWDAKSWQLQHTFRGHTKLIMSLAFSPDSRRLASGSRDGTMKIWDTTRWAETADH